jgi:hypothetical protein
VGFPNLVLPFSETLIASLSGRVLAVRVDDPSDVVRAAEYTRSSANRLSMVILDSPTPLDEVPFNDTWAGIKIAVFAPKMGQFRGLARRLRTVRELNPTIYLSAGDPENLTALRILSSVNIRCAAVFGDRGPIDWEGLADLMTYALATTVPHGPIEPFSTVAGRYQSDGWIEWGPVFFDDPRDFLHLDPDGRIALSRRELLDKGFIENDIGRLDEVIDSKAYRQRIDVRRRLFLEYHPCSRCPGWRVCMGKFAQNGTDRTGCAAFTVEMIALLDDLDKRREEPGKERHGHRHI